MSKVRGYLAVAGAVMIHMTLSTLYTLGNLNTYIISYQRMRVQQEHLTYGDSIWIISTSISGQGLFMCLAGCLQKKIGGRWTCVLGCSVYTSMNALTYLTVQKSFIGVVLTLGLLSNLGMGISYGAAIAVGVQWFPDNKGLVSGLIVGGFGLGAFIFNQVETFFLNPDNISTNSDGYFTNDQVLSSVPSLFLLLGGSQAAMQLIGIVFLFPPPIQDDLQKVDEKFPINKWRNFSRLLYVHGPSTALTIEKDPKERKITFTPPTVDTHKPEDNEEVKRREENLDLKKMLRRKEFYILWVTFALNIQTVQFINNYYKTFGQSFINDDYFLALIGSCGSVVNSVCRVGWGRLMDRFSYKTCMLLNSSLTAALMFSFIVVGSGGKVLYTIWVLAIYLVIGAPFALLPAVTLQVFGARHHGTNYGVLFTAPAISAVVGAFFIEVMMKHFSWFRSFCVFGVFAEIAFFITIFFPNNIGKSK